MKQIFLLLALTSLTIGALSAQFSIYLESGAAFSGYNDAQSPGVGESDRFSLTEDLSSDPVLHSRLNAYYKITPRHQVSLLATPLRVKAEGSFDRDIRYEGETFLAGEAIEALYRFDSYRLQYRYIFRNPYIRELGLTLKLRDAEIYLKSGDKKSAKTNTGFVPLIGFKFGYDFNPKWSLTLDGEALASPYGRAEDVLASLNYDVNDRFTLKAGYRLLEGGSDIDEVYTFALFHYAVLGLQVNF